MSSGQGGCWAASEESRLTASETRIVALAFTWSSRLPGNQLPPAVHRDGHRHRGLDHDGGRPVADRPGRRYRDTAQREIVPPVATGVRSEEHTSELQSPCNLVCRLLLEKKNNDHSMRCDSIAT